MSIDRKQALINIIAKMQAAETTDIKQEVVDAAGGWEPFAERAVDDALRKATSDVRKTINKIRRRSDQGVQLTLPGIDVQHVTLPWVLEGNKLIAPRTATKKQMKQQTKRDRRGINIEDQICTLREKTFTYLDEIGIPDTDTGQQIEDRFRSKK